METNRIAVTCSSCGRRSSVSERMQGRRIKCSGCSEIFRVPAKTGSTGAVPVAAPQPKTGTGSAILDERRRVQIHALASGLVTAASLAAFGLTALRGHLIPALILPLAASVLVLSRSALRLDAIEKVIDGSVQREAHVARRAQRPLVDSTA